LSTFSHKVFSIPVDILVALVAMALQFYAVGYQEIFIHGLYPDSGMRLRGASKVTKVILTIRLSQVGLGILPRDAA
jgi:hypothetical protein